MSSDHNFFPIHNRKENEQQTDPGVYKVPYPPPPKSVGEEY